MSKKLNINIEVINPVLTGGKTRHALKKENNKTPIAPPPNLKPKVKIDKFKLYSRDCPWNLNEDGYCMPIPYPRVGIIEFRKCNKLNCPIYYFMEKINGTNTQIN
jgi:hypothetical protein